jgi:hypothetical protein
MTPQQFVALRKRQRSEREFLTEGPRFVATIVAQCAGNRDANFMTVQPERRECSDDELASWLERRAARDERKNRTGDGS